MAIFRQYIAPFLIVLVFLVSLLAVSARSFLSSDMAVPAPIEDVETASKQAPTPKVDKTTGLQSLDTPTLPSSSGSVN